MVEIEGTARGLGLKLRKCSARRRHRPAIDAFKGHADTRHKATRCFRPTALLYDYGTVFDLNTNGNVEARMTEGEVCT
jgi:hypothetical protein